MNAAPNRFEALVQSGIRGLRAYDPGHDLVAFRRRFSAAGASGLPIELGSNENAFGPSPAARAAILDSLAELHRYPDPLGGDLKRALAAHHALQPTQILLGNGSHELLMQLGQLLAGPGTDVVVSRYGFAVYALAAQAAGATLRVAEAFERSAPMPLGHDADALAATVTPCTRLLFLANPNNPTGTWIASARLAQMLERIPSHVVVVVDEAYQEYADTDDAPSALGLLARFPNLLVTRTFSKAYGLAGLRVGYAVADPQLIALMERLRESFNVNSPALAAAHAALGDADHLAWVVRQNAEARDWLRAQFETRGHFVLPSRTNFLLVEFGPRCAQIEAALSAQGVILRPMAGYGLPHYLRITVGVRSEMQRLLDVLDGIEL